MHEKNATRFKRLDAIAADPRVECVWQEKGTNRRTGERYDNGIWVSLVGDWWCYDDCTCVHEWTVDEVIEVFGTIYHKPESEVDC